MADCRSRKLRPRYRRHVVCSIRAVTVRAKTPASGSTRKTAAWVCWRFTLATRVVYDSLHRLLDYPRSTKVALARIRRKMGAVAVTFAPSYVDFTDATVVIQL